MSGLNQLNWTGLKIFLRDLYPVSLCLIALSLPLSEFLLTIAIILLILSRIFSNELPSFLQGFRNRESLWWLSAVYLVHLAGMFYSNDWLYGLHDLRIKLPLLLIPLVAGTSRLLAEKEFKRVLWFFLAGVSLSTFAGAGVLVQSGGINELQNIRELSPFISHIRLALLLNLAVFILIYLIFTADQPDIKRTVLKVILLIWLVVFMILLRSITGWVIFLVLLAFLGIRLAVRNRELIPRVFVSVALVTLLLLVASFIVRGLARFYHTEELQAGNLEQYTESGNPYFHNPSNREIENGYYTWIYISEEELEPAWNRISKIPYDSLDARGQSLRFTLMRYLTSLGLRKDSAGMARLRPVDIQAIEKGYTNVIFLDEWSLYPKFYELVWEIDVYLKGGNPSGHSFTQRLEYWKTAFHIWKKHPVAGVGTGDVQQAFDRQYTEDKTMLAPEWRLRAHNQFVTFLVAFGLTGFLIIIVSFVIFLRQEKSRLDYYSVVFLLIAGLSMLNEDTLETHTGVSFFSFFLSLFLLARNNEYVRIQKKDDAGGAATGS